MGMPHDRLDKVVFIAACKLGQAVDFAQYNLFQKIYPDVVSIGARPSCTVVIGAVEITDFRVF